MKKLHLKSRTGQLLSPTFYSPSLYGCQIKLKLLQSINYIKKLTKNYCKNKLSQRKTWSEKLFSVSKKLFRSISIATIEIEMRKMKQLNYYKTAQKSLVFFFKRHMFAAKNVVYKRKFMIIHALFSEKLFHSLDFIDMNIKLCCQIYNYTFIVVAFDLVLV